MIKLDDDGKFYDLDGLKLQRVTDFLGSFGFGKNPFYTEFGRDKGTIIHECCFLLSKGRLDWDSVDPRILPKVKGYEKFLLETNFKPERLEEIVYDVELGIAGTYDQVGLFQLRLALIDLKNGAFLPFHKLQTALYVIMLRRKGIMVLDRYGLYLKDYGYRLIRYPDRTDEENALTLLKAAQIIKSYGG